VTPTIFISVTLYIQTVQILINAETGQVVFQVSDYATNQALRFGIQCRSVSFNVIVKGAAHLTQQQDCLSR
jgi:hypothetical protein